MRTILHVLSCGSAETCDDIRSALQKRGGYTLCTASSYDDLCALPADAPFEVAILNLPLSSREMGEVCAYIRRRWPRVKILVIVQTANDLDDPLYDEWLSPELMKSSMLALIERLAGAESS